MGYLPGAALHVQRGEPVSQYTLDIGAMSTGVGTPAGFTLRSASSGDFEVLADGDAPSGQAIEFSGFTLLDPSYATWDAPGSVNDMQVFMLIKPVWDASYHGGPMPYLRAKTAGDEGYVGYVRNNDQEYGLYYSVPGTAFTAINFGATPTIGVGDIVAVRFEIDGTTLREKHWIPANAADPLADEPGSWSYSTTDANVAAPGYIGIGGRQMLAGQRLLFLSATDSPSTESAPGPTTETEDPTVAIDDPIHPTGVFEGVHESSGYDSANNELTVTGVAADTGGSGLNVVEVRVNGGSWQTATGTSTWSITLDVSTFPTGDFLIEARATDGAGNTSAIDSDRVWHSPDGVWGFNTSDTPGAHAIPIDVEGYS